MPRAGAGDAPIVFNPQDQHAALTIGEADGRFDEVSVIQRLGFLALELDRVALARPYEVTKLLGIHTVSLCKDMQSNDRRQTVRITYAWRARQSAPVFGQRALRVCRKPTGCSSTGPMNLSN